jgi:cellulose synthase/poly-beta-1,6-N-acetylglucosamine synthase-like glycosyltransferase
LTILSNPKVKNSLSAQSSAKCFFMVLARDAKNVAEKIAELQSLGVPFVVVCGEEFKHPNVVYREAKGKWDAINFGAKFIPQDTEIILFNDVDNRIHNFAFALQCLSSKADIVYCRIKVSEGPQLMFYRILDPIRQRFHVCASGDFMLVKRHVFETVMPIPPCIAEDSYILFRALELGFRAYFCTETYVTTKKTYSRMEEEAYKNRTTLGIYQALSYSKPSPLIRVFYYLLPTFSPLLMLAGGDGVAWAKGIRKAVKANITKKDQTKF